MTISGYGLEPIHFDIRAIILTKQNEREMCNLIYQTKFRASKCLYTMLQRKSNYAMVLKCLAQPGLQPGFRITGGRSRKILRITKLPRLMIFFSSDGAFLGYNYITAQRFSGMALLAIHFLSYEYFINTFI